MMLEKILRRIIICGIFAVPFIPLVVYSSLYQPRIAAWSICFHIIVELITVAWIPLAVVYEEYRPRRSWILGAFALFVVIIAIADAQGVNPYLSFWSTYTRMDGWISLIHVFAFLVVVSSVIASEKIWRQLFQVSLGISVLISLFGFLQTAGVLPLAMRGQSGLSARIDSTIGNPIFLAVYLLFHIFIAGLLCYQTWIENPSDYSSDYLFDKGLAKSFVYIVIILIDAVALFLTGARGTILGLIGGIVLTIIIFAVTQHSYRLRIVAVITIVALVAFGGVLRLSKDTPFVQSIGSLNRFAAVSLGDGTVKSRLLDIGIAWKGVKERPILGWGQENYFIVREKYYDPRMQEVDPWNDRVHNIIFDWLIAGGILGLISYLLVFATTLWVLWTRSVSSIPERAVLTGLLAAYSINNLAVFDVILTYILFVIILSYIVFRERKQDKKEFLLKRKILPQNTLPFVAVLSGILLLPCVWYINVSAIVANNALFEALAPQDTLTKNLEYFKQAITYESYGSVTARLELCTFAIGVIQQHGLSESIKQQFFDLANHEMELQSERSPLDPRFPFYRGALIDIHGDYETAATLLKRAHELAPTQQSFLFSLAVNARERGDFLQELAYYKEAMDLDPSYSFAKQYYTATLFSTATSTYP